VASSTPRISRSSIRSSAGRRDRPASDRRWTSTSPPVQTGDGSYANPYRRITDAVVRARSDREAGAIPPEMAIRIHVAPGTYVGSFFPEGLAGHPDFELLPIVINVPRLELYGSTPLVLDPRGLPTAAGSGATILRPDFLLSQLQFLVLVTRTSANAIGNDVTVEGFSFDGAPFGVAAPNSGAVFADRVSGFRIRNNLMRRGDFGVVTRLASGTLEGNLIAENGEATSLTGGSLAQPATVVVRRNRATRNRFHGFIGIPNATVQAVPDGGTNPPELAAAVEQPLQTIFDRNDPADVQNLPDTLTVVFIGNDASNNGQVGIRFLGNVHPLDYRTADETQPLTGHLQAVVVGNTSVGNGEYGVDIEGGFTVRAEPRAFVQDLSVGFAQNSFVGNGRAGALFTFRHWAAAVGDEPLQAFKFAQESTYQVTDLPGNLGEFDLDHPETDPLDGTVLANQLVLNDVEVPHGTTITPR
jgi:hypothetical protein